MAYAEMTMALVECVDDLSDEELLGACAVMLTLLKTTDSASVGMLGTAALVLMSETAARDKEPWATERIITEMAEAVRACTKS